MTKARPRIQKLARFSLTTGDAARAATFYEAAFGCRRQATERMAGGAFERLMDVTGGAAKITLHLGQHAIELLQFDMKGRPYPAASASSDLIFQHFAIVVSDMAAAYRRLAGVPGWSPISRDGPQHLPPSSGGVTAFKFRDPEGHPLELIAFPQGAHTAWTAWSAPPRGETCLGIDHSAIGVADSAASIAFYQSHGLAVAGRSFNTGSEQERLDDVRGAEVEVTALAPPHPTPHLELLCYRSTRSAPPAEARSNDIASTRLVFEADIRPHAAGETPERITDPDGHTFLVVAP